MKKIILASIALISLGALSWLYGKSPIEEAMVTIQTADDKKIEISKETALLIPLIKDMFNDIGTENDKTILVPLPNVSAQEFKTIVSILEKIQAPKFKRPKDGGYIAQGIQPIIDTALQNKSIEDINKIIAASNFLDLQYIVNGAIRVITQKMFDENRDISVSKIIATIYPVFGVTEHNSGIAAHLLPFYTKQYNLIKAGNIKELSIADYIAIHGMPEIEIEVDSQNNRLKKLNLNKKRLTSLEGLQQINNITTVQVLLLAINQIDALPAGIFNRLTQLQRINLYRNQLKTLPAGIFNGLTQLQSVTVNYNSLESLPAGIFNGLTQLKKINFDHNKLKELPIGIFNGLVQLDTIDFYHNELKTLPAEIFNGLTQLNEIYFSHNQLESLPLEIFKGLSQLRTIDLKNNQISSLPEGIFNRLAALQSINLSENPLNLTAEQIWAANPQLPQGVDIQI